MNIRIDDLTNTKVHALLQEHLDDMYATSPPESVHALDLTALRKPNITFWSAWLDDELLGCGALKQLSANMGEIKSMRTANQFRRRGIAAAVLRHIIQEASQRGYQRLYLETGSMAFFEPARQLYLRHGFETCGPFEGYVEDPNSVFMTMKL